MNNEQIIKDIEKYDIEDYIIEIKRILNNNKLNYKIKRINYLISNNIHNLCSKVEILNWYFKIKKDSKNLLILNELVSNYYKADPSFLKVKTINQLLNENWSLKDIVYDSVKLSSSNIEQYEFQENELDYWTSMRSKNIKLYVALEYCGLIVGHIGAYIINKEEYLLLREGILNETMFTNSPNTHADIKYVYIPTIVINKGFRGTYALKKILSSFINKLSNELDNSTLNILVNTYSKEGKSLSEKLNFSFVTLHKDGSEIYELTIDKKENIPYKFI